MKVREVALWHVVNRSAKFGLYDVDGVKFVAILYPKNELNQVDSDQAKKML
jgi:hypothetical protein